MRSRHWRNAAWLSAAVVVVAVAAGGIVLATAASERTRECTVESITDVYVRHAPDYDRIRTIECGSIRTPRASAVEVTDPECEWDTVQVGSRYRITTVGIPVREL